MRWLAAVVMALVAVGCKPALLPNSDIKENDETRAVYDVIEAYRAAMEARDVTKIMALVGSDYFENGGTEDAGDDYGAKELNEHLKSDFERTKALRLGLHLKKMEIQGEKAVVEYRFQSRAQVSLPAGDQWVTKTDSNRMTLRRENGQWKIIAGL